jgi:hypothetical protein
MNNDTTNSRAAESNKHVWEMSELKTNVLHSCTGGYAMRTSLTFRAAYVTGIYLTFADCRYNPLW